MNRSGLRSVSTEFQWKLRTVSFKHYVSNSSTMNSSIYKLLSGSFKFILVPNVRGKDNSLYVCLKINKLTSKPTRMMGTCVTQVQRNETLSEKRTHFLNFIKESNQLCLCPMEFLNNLKSRETISINLKVKHESLPQFELNEDYTSLQNYRELSDMRIEVEEYTFHVHKIIIAHRLPELFQIRREDVLTIVNVDKTTIELLLTYAYGGKIVLPNVNAALKLSKVAHEYNLHPVKDYCRFYIETRSSPTDFFSVLEHAITNSVDYLRQLSVILLKKDRGLLYNPKWDIFVVKYSRTMNELRNEANI